MKSNIPHTICSDPKVGELLVPYGLGTLNSEDTTRFEDHLIECHFCQTELEASYNALDILSRARPDLVEDLKNSGEDFESQLARLHGKTRPGRESESMRGKWRRLWNALLNPWVYGPVAATVAAVLIIIQMDVRAPLTTPPPSPRISQLYSVKPVPDSTVNLPDQKVPDPEFDSAQEMALLPTAQQPATAGVSGSAPEASAEPPVAIMTESNSIPSSLTSPRKSQTDAHVLPMDQTNSDHSSPLALRGGRSSDMQVQVDGVDFKDPNAKPGSPHSTLQQRTSELLKNPPAYQDLSLESLLKKTPGFKVDPSGILRVRDVRKGATSPVGDAATVKEMNTAAAYHTGIEAYQKQDYAAAITALTETVQGNPRNGQAWFYLGISQLQMQKWAPAMQALTEADSLAGGRDSAALYYLSLASIKSGNLEKAKVFITGLAERQDSIGIRASELKRLLEQPAKP